MLAGALAALTTGCGAGWKTIEGPLPQRFERRQAVELWHGGHVTRLHGVETTQDSVTGIGWLAPLECDSCRLGYARTDVDSLRTGNPTGGFWKSFGLVMGGLLVGTFVACVTAGCGETT